MGLRLKIVLINLLTEIFNFYYCMKSVGNLIQSIIVQQFDEELLKSREINNIF